MNENDHRVRNRVMDELNQAGLFEWSDVEGSPEENQARLNKATIELIRLAQTLAKEIDLVRAEVAELQKPNPKRPS